jgi:hypothetical protein
VKGNECLIGNICYPAGTTSSQNCMECNPTQSKTDWSPAAFSCMVGQACYANGDKHPSPTCTNVVCDSAINPLAWTVKGNECLIDNTCYASGASHPSVTCTVATCDPASSTTSWTVTGNGCLIGNVCYAANDLHPTGCWTCNPLQSKTSWTAMASCSKIIIAALNQPSNGNLGGITGANALCATQAAAAGFPGTWKAFLSTSTQNVQNLITGTNATTIPVVNSKGESMFSSWNAAFSSTSYWPSPAYIYTFDGTTVNSSFCSDADGWTGIQYTGAPSTYNCNDWTSSSTSVMGANGEWDLRDLLRSETHTCSSVLAVACFQIP